MGEASGTSGENRESDEAHEEVQTDARGPGRRTQNESREQDEKVLQNDGNRAPGQGYRDVRPHRRHGREQRKGYQFLHVGQVRIVFRFHNPSKGTTEGAGISINFEYVI